MKRKKPNPWTKWRLGAVAAVGVVLLFHSVRASDAFEQARIAAHSGATTAVSSGSFESGRDGDGDGNGGDFHRGGRHGRFKRDGNEGRLFGTNNDSGDDSNGGMLQDNGSFQDNEDNGGSLFPAPSMRTRTSRS